MRKLLNYYLLLLLCISTFIVKSQKIIYSTDKKIAVDGFKIIGEVNNQILLFTIEHAPKKYFIYTYDHKLNQINKKEVHFENEVTAPYFFVYDQQIYILYQYWKGNTHYVSYKIVDNSGKETSTIDLINGDFTDSNIGLPSYRLRRKSEDYSIFFSEDKNTVVVEKQYINKDTVQISMLLLTNKFKNKTMWELKDKVLTENEVFSNFCVDNKGNIAFTRQSDMAERTNLCIKKNGVDSVEYQVILPKGVILSSNIHLEADNYNKSFLLVTEFGETVKNITGLYTFCWDIFENTPKFISKTDFKEGLRQLHGDIKPGNRLYFRNLRIENDNGYIIDGNYLTKIPRYYYLNNEIELPENGLAKSIVIICLDTSGIVKWFKQILKDEIKGNLGIEYYSVFTNSKNLYYLYSQQLKNSSRHLSIQAINGNGNLSDIKPLNETDNYVNGKKGIYPILEGAVQISGHEFILPYNQNGRLRLSIIEF